MDEQDPYQPPASRVLDDGLPADYGQAPLTGIHLRTAGSIGLVYLALSFPYLYLSFREEVPTGALYTFLSVLMLGLYAYLLWMLLRFTRRRFGLNNIATLVWSLIGLSTIMTVFGILEPDTGGEALTAVDWLMIGSLVVYGALSIVLGLRLARVTTTLVNFRRFALINIVMGALIASIVLAVVGVLAGLLWDLFIVLLFFEAATERDAAAEALPDSGDAS